MKQRTKPYLGPLLAKLAPHIGATVIIEPVWGIVGQIAFPNGRKRYFRYNSLDLNTLGASEVAKDKDYANFFLARAGYPVIPGKPFYSKAWSETIGIPYDADAAYEYAKELSFPVVVKPNSGSQGQNVSVASNRKELERCLRATFAQDRVALVQKRLIGRDYRVVVLDDAVISAYERIPLNVVGDGKNSVRELIKKKERAFVRSGRDTRIPPEDPAILRKLAQVGLHLDSVPSKGEQVFLRDNANLSTGGDSVDVTDRIHPDFSAIAIAMTREMGLRLCGVDLMIDRSIEEAPASYHVLEVNSAPGLDHYVTGGTEQQRIVEDLYLKVLTSMAEQ